MDQSSDPMEAVRQRISSLQSRLNDLQTRVRLASAREAAGNVETQANAVADQARTVRELGYAWEKDLEPRCLDYRQRWQNLKPEVMSTLDRESNSLESQINQVQMQVNSDIARAITPQDAQMVLPDAENALTSLESAADAAEKSIQGMFSQFTTDLSALDEHLKQVKWMLDQAAESKVSWLANEALVLAVKADYVRDQKDNPKGILYLTDQRVVFEHKEEVATKKVLFVATAKQLVQEVLLEMALAEVANVEATKKGFMGHEDHLEFKFAPSAKIHSAHFHIDGQDSHEWDATIGRIKSGAIEAARVAPLSDAEKTRIQNAPTKCPNCGGALTAPVLRGQTEIKCPYCGTVTRF